MYSQGGVFSKRGVPLGERRLLEAVVSLDRGTLCRFLEVNGNESGHSGSSIPSGRAGTTFSTARMVVTGAENCPS